MTAISPAVALAWKIAALEARESHSEFIEKEHLLIGLYSIEKVLSLADFRRNPKIARSILGEKDALDFPLRQSEMDAATFRRRLRRALPRGHISYNDKVIHRSARCKECFRRAALLSNGKEVTCIQILNAILEDPGAIIQEIINTGSSEMDYVRPGSTWMIQSLQKYTEEKEQKEELLQEIAHTRHTLTLAPKDSELFRVLKAELVKKTVFLARICLDIHDTYNLLMSLKELVYDTGESRAIIVSIIHQLEYMQKEGIRIGQKSSDQIRIILDNIEHEVGKK